MADYIIMFGILAFLAFMLMFKAEYMPNGNGAFFDRHNSKAMRGFWSIIVILVHIPQPYQNTIQDMIGSFAYIGVTFFFMTSGYGLSVGVQGKPDSIKRFWRARLPKLLIPNWITNAVFALLLFALCGGSLGGILNINRWVVWLLGCYLAFWIGYRFPWKAKLRRGIVCCLVFVLSITVYILQKLGLVQTVTWCTEVFGFIWGMLLFAGYEKCKAFAARKWMVKVSAACLISLVLGVSYLLGKGIAFWGDYVLKVLLGLSILSFILLLNAKVRIGNKLSSALGDISFEIFLAHVPVFQIVEKVFPGLGSGAFILLTLGATVLFAAILHNLSSILLKKLK